MSYTPFEVGMGISFDKCVNRIDVMSFVRSRGISRLMMSYMRLVMNYMTRIMAMKRSCGMMNRWMVRGPPQSLMI